MPYGVGYATHSCVSYSASDSSKRDAPVQRDASQAAAADSAQDPAPYPAAGSQASFFCHVTDSDQGYWSK